MPPRFDPGGRRMNNSSWQKRPLVGYFRNYSIPEIVPSRWQGVNLHFAPDGTATACHYNVVSTPPPNMEEGLYLFQVGMPLWRGYTTDFMFTDVHEVEILRRIPSPEDGIFRFSESYHFSSVSRRKERSWSYEKKGDGLNIRFIPHQEQMDWVGRDKNWLGIPEFPIATGSDFAVVAVRLFFPGDPVLILLKEMEEYLYLYRDEKDLLCSD